MMNRKMSDWVDIEKLQLSSARPQGYVPTPSPSLLDRVRDYGPVEPVVVRPMAAGKFEILANAETWVAAGRAGLHKVPVEVRDDIEDDEARDVVQAHYVSRRRTALDEALYFEEQLDRFGGCEKRGSISRLAAASGRSRHYVAHSLRLLMLPAEIQDMIRHGKLSAGQARPLITIPNRARQIRLAQTIIANKLTARDAETLAKRERDGTTETGGNEQQTKVAKDPDTRRLERLVSEAIGATFLLEEGRAIIDYCGNLEILEGILSRLGYRG